VALGVLVEEDGRWSLRGRLDEVTRAILESLRAPIEKQVGRLEPEAQRILEVAELLGNQFTAAAVAAGLGEDTVAVEECCDSLARQRQLVLAGELTTLPDGTPVAGYGFTHNLYPQVVGARVAAARRVRAHRRISEWLEAAHAARAGVDRFRASALSTAEPNLQALAWEATAKVAMAEKDWRGRGKTVSRRASRFWSGSQFP
jgi:predicted ATPase